VTLITNRLAVILGGSGGIGSAIAAELLNQHARVIIVGHEAEAVEEATERLGRGRRDLAAMICDIGAADKVTLWATDVLSTTGVLTF
jgi:NAD(P)-dependent dehydrogenase (short-subunit alcohol dehydrogenase family)